MRRRLLTIRFTRSPQGSNAFPRGRGDFAQDDHISAAARRRCGSRARIGDAARERSSVVEKAQVDERILLTFDLGFGAILALGVLNRPTTVIFRLTDERADAVNQRLEAVISEQGAALQSGALILVEDTRYRMRLLPIR
jgi:predicted nuclease of predicted toxin-antitoxin system